MPKKRKQPLPGHDSPSRTVRRTYRIPSWFPWAVAGVYLAVMTYLTVRHHRIGGFGVETDFYAELVPQARALLRGEFSPELYGTKGPVYSIILAIIYLFIREYFFAGLVINFIGAAVFLVTGYYLIKTVFNTITAVFFIIAAAGNFIFQTYTYQAGTDMPFMAFSMLSLLFMFRDDTIRSLVLSALFALLAFLTRYNGAFLIAGAILTIFLTGHFRAEGLKRLGIWLGVFVLAGLPWFIPNWIATGNPVNNGNYINVLLEFYGFSSEQFDYENWTEIVPQGIDSFGDVIMHDPVYFAGRFLSNIGSHFLLDLRDLIGIRIAVLTVIGIVLFFFAHPDRRKLLYLSFGAFYFLILALVFYNARFSLTLIAFYLPVSVWPLTSVRFLPRNRWFSIACGTAIFALTASVAATSLMAVHRDITSPYPQLANMRLLGLSLGEIESDPHQKVCAREPHIAYYAGLIPRMMPSQIETVEDLVAFCREQEIRYIAYTSIEYSVRPQFQALWESRSNSFPGLEPVTANRAGLVFRVTEP